MSAATEKSNGKSEADTSAAAGAATTVATPAPNSFDDWGFRTVHFDDFELTLRQVTDVGVGGSIWDAALVLAKYLARRSEFPDSYFAQSVPISIATTHTATAAAATATVTPTSGDTKQSSGSGGATATPTPAPAETTKRPLRVIEIGAGIGICGMVCALRGAAVSITDLPSHVPLIQHNVNLNTYVPPLTTTTTTDSAKASSAAPATATAVAPPAPIKSSISIKYPIVTPVACEPFSWGDAGSGLTYGPPYDLIIGSDLTYDPRFFAPLIHALLTLSDQNTVILYGYERRQPRELEFFQMLKQHFTFIKVRRPCLFECVRVT